MFIQYGYQKFLIREIRDLRLKKQASVRVSAVVFEKINYVIYLTIIVRFDFTFSKTISPMFYREKHAEWLLFVLLKWDIKQINMICCKVIKMLEVCDTDNIYKQNVNIGLYKEIEFNWEKIHTGFAFCRWKITLCLLWPSWKVLECKKLDINWGLLMKQEEKPNTKEKGVGFLWFCLKYD